MSHDSFKPTNRDEASTEINPKSVGKDEPAEVVNTEQINNTVHIKPGVSDVFAAINQAIADNSPEGVEVVIHMPDGGSYSPSTDLDLTPGANGQAADTPVRIRGAVRGAKKTNNTGVFIDMSGATIQLNDGSADARTFVQIEGLQLRDTVSGTILREAASGGIGLSDCTFRDLQLDSGSIQFSKASDITSTQFENVHFNGADQFIVGTGGDWNDVTFSECTFQSALAADPISLGGIKLDGLRFRDCIFQGCDENVFLIDSVPKYLDFDGCYWEANNQTASAGKSSIEATANISGMVKISGTVKNPGVSPWFHASGFHCAAVLIDALYITTASGINVIEHTDNGFENLRVDGIAGDADLDLTTFGETPPRVYAENLGGTVTLPGGTEYQREGEAVSRRGNQPRTAAPANPQAGDEALADGANWNPLGNGNAAKVIYDGSAWSALADLGTSL